MDVQQLDAIVRVAAATLLLLLAALLFGGSGRRRLAVLFAPVAVCLCGFVAGNTPDAALRLTGLAGAAAHLASGYGAVFLWWFCLACFDRDFRPRGWVLAAGLAWLAVASADRGLFGPALADRGLSWLLVAIGLGMVGHLGWRLIGDRAGDLIEPRRRARAWVVVLLGGQLLIDLCVDVVFGLDWRPRAFAIAQNGVILAFAAWMVTWVARADATPALSRQEAEPVAVADEGEARLAARLAALVEVERVHLDPAITFEGFARRMGAPERTVRRLINHRLGHDHFRAFLNAQRMHEARRLLADPARAGDKLIAVALDSGFTSLASFNRVFRASEGRTPSQFRDAALGGDRQAGFEERSAAF